MPLFVFMAGSPFFSEKFHAHDGAFRHLRLVRSRFCLLLVPAPNRWRSCCLPALASMILILIHHIHLLMYLPTIARHRGACVIISVQGFWPAKMSSQGVAAGVRVLSPCCSCQHNSWGPWRYPRKSSSVICRAAWPTPSRTNLLGFSYIWLSVAFSRSPGYLGSACPPTSWAFRLFALLIWLHAPLWRYFADLIRAPLSDDFHRRIVMAAIIMVSVGYLIMFAIVFDYSRWDFELGRSACF